MPKALGDRRLCRPAKPGRYQPRVEVLEDRRLMSGLSYLTAPVLPTIDAAEQAHLQAILLEGEHLGNQPSVFTKVGDSNTQSHLFLNFIGLPSYDPNNPAVVGGHSDLAPSLNYFRGTMVDSSGENSFTRESLAAQSGWTTGAVLDPARGQDSGRAGILLPNESPLAGEIRVIRPGIALILLGTNDLQANNSPAAFGATLAAVVNTALARGVIPVLSTIPDVLRAGDAGAALLPVYNQMIADVASAYGVPLWNYWRAMQHLPGRGLGPDLLHFSNGPDGGALLTEQGLTYGFNLRNFTAIEVLDKLKRVVIDGGAPDSATNPNFSPSITRLVEKLYHSLLSRPVDPDGLAYWGEQLAEGVNRTVVANGIARSTEHLAEVVNQDYLTLLGRPAEQGGLSYWTAHLSAGGSEADVRLGILLSNEYSAGHGVPYPLVQGFYEDILGRGPDATGGSFWFLYLLDGGDRATMAREFTSSQEAYSREVDTYFQSYLHRAASPQEQAMFVDLVASGQANFASVEAAILGTDEYFHDA